MSVLTKVRLISNERLDIPDFLNLDNFSDSDWIAFMGNFMGSTPFVVQGLDIVLPFLPSSDTEVSVNIAGSVMFHPTSANVSGGFYVGASTESVQSVTLTSGATNYIELDQTSSTGAPDTRKIWDPSANNGLGSEFSQIIDSVTYLDVEVTVNTVGFSANKVPIAKVVVNSAAPALITSITDCRPMFFRLGTGGTTPDPTNSYSWLNLPTGYDRVDVPVTITTGATLNPFQGSDKNIHNFKEWMDAVMTRIKEINGGAKWFDSSIASLTTLAQNQNVHMLDQGILWNWNLVTETLTWTTPPGGNPITFQIPGTTNNNTLADDSAILTLGSVPADNDVSYVGIDRTHTAGIIHHECAASAAPIGEDYFVFARRDGDDVLVGTHSFRIKPTDTSESDYSDHLAKEKMLKPVPRQAAPDTLFLIYPSQRLSGGKRRYVYISPNTSSLFPRSVYLTGVYDGGVNDDQCTVIDFTPNGADLEVGATLPSVARFVLTTATLAGFKGFYTPILICITVSDSIEVTFGTPQVTAADAKLDANLPVSASDSYPVAIAVIYVSNPGGVVSPITDDMLLDRRPTGAGGSGGGVSTGNYWETVAIAGQTLFTIPTWTYLMGLNDLSVVENGVELFEGAGADYTETTVASITLNYPAVAGERYKFRTGKGLTVTAIGNVVGPGVSTDNALVRFDLATGKVIQNSGAILTDGGDLSGIVDLTMTGTLIGGSSPFTIESVEANGGGAIGFKFDTQHALVANGSRVLSIQNNTTEYSSLRRGTNLFGNTDNIILSLNDNTGTLAFELSAGTTAVKALMDAGSGMEFLGLEMTDDPTWGAGYKYTAIDFTQSINPNILMTAEMNAIGTVEMLLSGGQVGGGAGSFPKFTVSVADDAGGVNTSELGLFTEDYTACNRTDVRFNAIAIGYLGIASTGAFFGANALTTPTTWAFESGAVDGATAIGYTLDTQNTLANAAAELLSLQNNGVPKFVIDKNGNITTMGTITGVLTAPLFTNKGDILTATAPSTVTVLPVGANPDGFVLTLNSFTATGLQWSAAGAGDVLGPGSSTNNALVLWNGIAGTNIKNSSTTINASGIMTMGAAVNFKRNINAAYAIALANDLKATMNTHAADGGEHFHGGAATPDIVNFPVVTANATDLATLKTLCLDLFTAYAAHDVDAASAGGGSYHNNQANAHILTSALIPTTLDQAVTRLNDLKTKYNLHYQDAGTGAGSSHTADLGPAEAVADATGDYTTAGETIIGVVDTTTARAVTLSDADKIVGRVIIIKDESGNATAQNITVSPQTGTIDGVGSVPIAVDYGTLRVYSEGSNWFSV